VSNEETPEGTEPRPEDLTDELAKKYDPERLLRMMSKKAGRGDPLDPTTRAKYEKRFGVDLGHVRIITGEFAEEFNRKREAYAVTIGSTGMVLMGNSPERAAHTAAGQALLAHELTHVAQASKVSGHGLNRRGQFDNTLAFSEQHEAEAHQVEDEVEAESKGQGATEQSANANQTKMEAEKAMRAQLEKIKSRVMEMMAEAARNQWFRNGPSRRP